MNTRLREIRKEKKITQAQLAELIGVKYPTVNRYETGKRMPKISIAKKISEVLGCTIDDLFADQDKSE